MSAFHQEDKTGLLFDNGEYQATMLDQYNAYLALLKRHFKTIRISEGYQLEFKNELINFSFIESFTDPGYALQYGLRLSITPPEISKSGLWILPSDLSTNATKQEQKAKLDETFKYFIKSDYQWVKAKTFKIPDYNMEDYINMFIRPRVTKCDGKYYDSFNAVVMEHLNEKSITEVKPVPPVEEGILKVGYGIHKAVITKEKLMAVKIPFFPPTFMSTQENYFSFFSTKEMYHFIKTTNKGLPAADTFFVLSCIIVTEVAEPKSIVLEMSYALVILASSIVEG